MQSKRFTLNMSDYKSLAITIGFAAISAAVAKAIELVPTIDFGGTSEALIVATVVLAILKTAQKYLDGKK